MKLRLEKGTIKIRLAPFEIDKLNTNKSLEEILFLSENNQFKYSLLINDSITACSVFFRQSSLEINIPNKKAVKWMNSNQVGIKETIVTDKGDEFALTLEEDLPPRKHKKRN